MALGPDGLLYVADACNHRIQVFTRDGWLWINPYVTLVSAYERLIHGRGRQIAITHLYFSGFGTWIICATASAESGDEF